ILSLHDALPICAASATAPASPTGGAARVSLGLLAKEGWPRHQEDDAEGHQSWRGRGGQSSKRVWNAFRNISSQMTTPSAPLRWLRSVFLMSQPPLLILEGHSDS